MPEAFAQLAATRPGARLIVLGEIDQRERPSIEGLAERLGIAGSIELRGQVQEEEYWRALRGADVAVRLRPTVGTGEASDAICDCIAARVPTITSEGGWEAELPEQVVLTVPVECPPGVLAGRIAEILDSPELAERVRAAQEGYATENSFARVAERYMELLSL